MTATTHPPLAQTLLGDRLGSRANHFNALRLALALMVIVDHAWLIARGEGATEIGLFGLSSGYLAVNGFFVLSGLLIARSLDRTGFGAGYVLARVLRLYPALIVFGLIGVLVIGPFAATGPYPAGEAAGFLFELLRFGDTMGGPPNFYTDNPLPGEFASQLWTLRYEVLCYVAAPLALMLGLLRRPLAMIGLTALLGIAVFIVEPNDPKIAVSGLIASCLRFGFAFGVGMTLWAARAWVKPGILPVLVTSGAFIGAGLLGQSVGALSTLWLAAGLLWLGLLPAKPSKAAGETDISYGIYVWHFPVMQVLFGAFGIISPVSLLVAGTAVTVALAWLSWVLVEKPAMALKRRLRPALTVAAAT